MAHNNAPSIAQFAVNVIGFREKTGKKRKKNGHGCKPCPLWAVRGGFSVRCVRDCSPFSICLHRRTCADRCRHRQGNWVPNCVRDAKQRVRDLVPNFVEGESKGGNRPVRQLPCGTVPLFARLTRRCNTAPGPATAGGRGRFHRLPACHGCRSGRWRRRQTPRWHRRICSWKAGG